MGRPAAVIHCRLVALAPSVRSFARALVATPFQSDPLLPRPEQLKAPRACGSDLINKTNLIRRVSSIRLFHARQRFVTLLLCRRIQPPAGAITCVVVWPVEAPTCLYIIVLFRDMPWNAPAAKTFHGITRNLNLPHGIPWNPNPIYWANILKKILLIIEVSWGLP